MSFSAAEVEYCTLSLQHGLRLDGRAWNDFRPIELEVGVVAQASGSARLHLGDTDVIVGVKVGKHGGSCKPWRAQCHIAPFLPSPCRQRWGHRTQTTQTAAGC